MKKNLNKQYKDDEHQDLDKAFPDIPFTQHDFEIMSNEVKEIRKTIAYPPHTRHLWIAKNGGGKMDPLYGLQVNPFEYNRLAKKWQNFTEWAARKEYADGKRIEQLDEMSKQLHQRF